MRQPERIERVLEKLRIIWNVYQDQRLGQLLENIWVELFGFKTIDHWNTEDVEWEKAMDFMLLEMDKGIETYDGRVLFRDRIWLVTKDELYED